MKKKIKKKLTSFPSPSTVKKRRKKIKVHPLPLNNE
jgi:hypothetical protein